MATDPADLSGALASEDWPSVVEAIGRAERFLQDAPPGDSVAASVIEALVRLAGHTKWEVRRAIANAAARTVHASFESSLARLALDDNAQVREAARRASLRRRDWQHASSFGKQHERHINDALDDIE